MTDLSGIPPYDGTTSSNTSVRARGYRQAWLDALEDASMSRSDRWKMPAHDPAGDKCEPENHAPQIARARVPESSDGMPPTIPHAVRETPDTGLGEVSARHGPHGAMRQPSGVTLHGIERAIGMRSVERAGESSAGPASRRSEALLWQRQRLTVLPLADGGVEVWVRDAAMSGASRVAGLLQDLRRTFGDTAASLVKVAVNGKVIYRQDTATHAGRPHSEVIRDGS